jgi:hypothetical protein
VTVTGDGSSPPSLPMIVIAMPLLIASRNVRALAPFNTRKRYTPRSTSSMGLSVPFTIGNLPLNPDIVGL